MSKRMTFGTCVTRLPHLQKACDRMRQAGLKVEGPATVSVVAYVFGTAVKAGAKETAWEVKLPGWYGPCYFAADGSGRVSADNESNYYDERPIDAKTGLPVDRDANGREYRVHPDVRAGKKLAGDDGTGDIRLFRRLLSEYTAVGIEEEAARIGGVISYREVNETTGALTLTVDVPEVL